MRKQPDTPRLAVKVTQVRDPSGRTLDFEYERCAFVFCTTDVITRTSAPSGVEVRFEYDISKGWGSMTR